MKRAGPCIVEHLGLLLEMLLVLLLYLVRLTGFSYRKQIGASAVVKENVFGLEDYSKATLFHNFVSSIAGAVFSITISAPLDVIKTRIQAKSAANSQSGLSIVKEMIAKEGFGSFFKVFYSDKSIIIVRDLHRKFWLLGQNSSFLIQLLSN